MDEAANDDEVELIAAQRVAQLLDVALQHLDALVSGGELAGATYETCDRLDDAPRIEIVIVREERLEPASDLQNPPRAMALKNVENVPSSDADEDRLEGVVFVLRRVSRRVAP